ncbi:MAG TPA: hypothetical protein VMW18_04875 [Candidatus Binatia bacterium]|nr:hypothetical protein [Candidatus Binatia bacterium]
MFGTIGVLIDAYIEGLRPGARSFYAFDAETFYSHLCEQGADVIFLHASYVDFFQRLKLDPSFCDIPVVMIDSWERHAHHSAREHYLGMGAAAVLFLPVTSQSVESVLDSLFPETTLKD